MNRVRHTFAYLTFEKMRIQCFAPSKARMWIKNGNLIYNTGPYHRKIDIKKSALCTYLRLVRFLFFLDQRDGFLPGICLGCGRQPSDFRFLFRCLCRPLSLHRRIFLSHRAAAAWRIFVRLFGRRFRWAFFRRQDGRGISGLYHNRRCRRLRLLPGIDLN